MTDAPLIRIGPDPFAVDAKGQLETRIGTIFLRTPGLVTTRGIHAMQRMAWIAELNRRRAEQGMPPLTEAEEAAELAESVDLLFDERYALIRPDPKQMALALRGDELLQTVISKRRIRYLNIQDQRVRDALRRLGDAWRMAPIPLYEEDIRALIRDSRVGIGGRPIYYYNRTTGTRFLTLGAFESLARLPESDLRAHLVEIKKNLQCRNRFANPEVAFLPKSMMEVKTFIAHDFENLSSDALKNAYVTLLSQCKANLKEPYLRRDDPENPDWRRALSCALLQANNETGVSAVIDGLSPEFFMQIEWLPGGEVDHGDLIFDPIFSEADAHPEDAALQSLCDHRARTILFNYLSEYSRIEYINIGRVRRSLSGRTGQGPRAMVYIVEMKEEHRQEPQVKIIRIQRWTAATHLAKGRPILSAIIDAEDYTDYVMDRRLGARQLGMHVPARMTPRTFRENVTDRDGNAYKVWTGYFERDYIQGRASDKIPDALYALDDFAIAFCRLLGQAAAANLVVGRARIEGGATLFDDGDEIIQFNRFQMPERLVLSEPTGSFTNYAKPYEETLDDYARALRRRRPLIKDFASAVDAYVNAFEAELARIQQLYRDRRKGFDRLFHDRPMDVNGSIAYRWKCVLARLDGANPARLAQQLRAAILA